MPIKDTHALEREAARFTRALTPRTDGATIVTLSGELGAGKTSFVKAAARTLGLREHITSPTFVIMKIYPLHRQRFQRMVHIDAYRLKGEHHLRVLGWDELVRDPHTLIFMEWPEHAGDAVAPHALRIALRYSEGDGREITYENVRAQASGSH